MLAQVHFPQQVLTDDLDRYLAEGWFRMGQTIFTTNFLNFNKNFYSAVWLRIVLNQCVQQPTFEKLKKSNSRFSLSLHPASITAEKEQLFSRYRREVSFEPSPSLHHLLFGRESATNVFRTMEVTLHDGGELIGCGFFDIGKNSAAGISSFYDPRYKKFSLGKYLIHLKIEYCKTIGLQYFYPGYFVPGYTAFDYKLKIHPGALEYYQLRTRRWAPIKSFGPGENPIMVMKDKLTELKDVLAGAGIPSKIFQYEYYDANLVHDLSHMELFDSPVFLHYFDEFDGVIQALVIFDVRDQQFHWQVVKSLWTSDVPSIQDDHFAAHLLKVEQDLLATTSAADISKVVKEALQSAGRN
jgi:leucyl-tRNA---protein transferase